MQKVSEAYKESMKSNLRGRGYMSVSFGLINQKAQNKAYVYSTTGQTVYSNPDIFKTVQNYDNYATLEKDYTKVDGSMVFLPKSSNYTRTGLISKDPVSSDYTLIIKFKNQEESYESSDLTIDFGENYPTEFNVYIGAAEYIKVTDNDKSVWSAGEILDAGISASLKIVVRTMKNPETRLRIYSILFGKGVVFNNEDIIDSSLEAYVSPISEDVPQFDFSLTLNNIDQYFNVDNPISDINYFEKGQKLDVYYGYTLPDDSIEWFQGGHFLMSEWESDDSTATIRAYDCLRDLNADYYKGEYNVNGVSFYTLAENLFKEADITDYSIDERLKNIKTTIPMPRVTIKEGLQLIANATRSVLTQSRSGTICIEGNFNPTITTPTCNAQADYSNVASVKLTTMDKSDEYATLCQDYTTVDGNMLFLPKTGSATKKRNFVSDVMSDETGSFTTNPTVILPLEAKAHDLVEIIMRFSYSIVPSDFTIQTYLRGSLVEEFDVVDNTQHILTINRVFEECDTLKIIFTKTSEPYNKVILKWVGNLKYEPSFEMSRNDMTSSPLATKSEKIKQVNVMCHTLMDGTRAENVIDEDVSGWDDEEAHYLTYYFDNPCQYYKITESGSDSTTIEEYGAYYVKIKDYGKDKHHLTVTAQKGQVNNQPGAYGVTINTQGESVLWDNPLVDISTVYALGRWLGEYYKSELEYEFDTRGNPEMDANDRVYQENQWLNEGKMQVNAYRVTTNFDSAFSGHVVTRRKGG